MDAQPLGEHRVHAQQRARELERALAACGGSELAHELGYTELLLTRLDRAERHLALAEGGYSTLWSTQLALARRDFDGARAWLERGRAACASLPGDELCSLVAPELSLQLALLERRAGPECSELGQAYLDIRPSVSLLCQLDAAWARRPRAQVEGVGAAPLRIDVASARWLSEATIGDRRVDVAVDPTRIFSVGSDQLARALGVELSPTQPLALVTIEALELGQLRLRELPVVLQHGEPGPLGPGPALELGVDVLAEFGRIDYHFADGQLEVGSALAVSGGEVELRLLPEDVHTLLPLARLEVDGQPMWIELVSPGAGELRVDLFEYAYVVEEQPPGPRVSLAGVAVRTTTEVSQPPRPHWSQGELGVELLTNSELSLDLDGAHAWLELDGRRSGAGSASPAAELGAPR
ncbi:hypothetical protein G6O69_24930 [Pseudenhygromyxa sp. WMMC2535]|uniref:hypothetical protein n=1 Tax=Pseudenhygromyxa sp. WMMC2535 TaxID=2712867 RepID=UPI0015580F17|nr:hypothetical protein [Pseudenhygromyxa sp. WMMC2535]NVB41108.1 hypothetical protein [Pseudenhygromyxa sp. WMMC2535]